MSALLSCVLQHYSGSLLLEHSLVKDVGTHMYEAVCSNAALLVNRHGLSLNEFSLIHL